MGGFMTAYQRLADRFARIATVREAISVLRWDSEVMMPRGGGPARADQTAVLSSIAHTMLVDTHLSDDLAEAASAPESDPWRAANLHLMQRQYQRAAALPV